MQRKQTDNVLTLGPIRPHVILYMIIPGGHIIGGKRILTTHYGLN